MKEINFLTRIDFTRTLESMEVDDYFTLTVPQVARENARNMCSTVGKRLGRTFRVIVKDAMTYRVLRIN